jgi:hypothetical protein
MATTTKKTATKAEQLAKKFVYRIFLSTGEILSSIEDDHGEDFIVGDSHVLPTEYEPYFTIWDRSVDDKQPILVLHWDFYKGHLRTPAEEVE